MKPAVQEAKHFKYQILGDEWQIYKVSENDDVIMSDTAEAETNLDSKEIYFKEINLDAVIHELTHIYFRSTYVRFTSITVSDMEEIAVALFADRGELIIQQAKEIQRILKDLK